MSRQDQRIVLDRNPTENIFCTSTFLFLSFPAYHHFILTRTMKTILHFDELVSPPPSSNSAFPPSTPPISGRLYLNKKGRSKDEPIELKFQFLRNNEEDEKFVPRISSCSSKKKDKLKKIEKKCKMMIELTNEKIDRIRKKREQQMEMVKMVSEKRDFHESIYFYTMREKFRALEERYVQKCQLLCEEYIRKMIDYVIQKK